ncbi:MAG TPA: type II toxin-antitoxin system HicA family toxin [Candidatus Dormibacteraeota bacterium]
MRHRDTAYDQLLMAGVERAKALIAAGWNVVRQSGSHEVWAHPGSRGPDRRGRQGQRHGASRHAE